MIEHLGEIVNTAVLAVREKTHVAEFLQRLRPQAHWVVLVALLPTLSCQFQDTPKSGVGEHVPHGEFRRTVDDGWLTRSSFLKVFLHLSSFGLGDGRGKFLFVGLTEQVLNCGFSYIFRFVGLSKQLGKRRAVRVVLYLFLRRCRHFPDAACRSLGRGSVWGQIWWRLFAHPGWRIGGRRCG